MYYFVNRDILSQCLSECASRANLHFLILQVLSRENSSFLSVDTGNLEDWKGLSK